MRNYKILILIMILSSCDNSKSRIKDISFRIELPSNLNKVIFNFHNERCIKGVPSIMIHSFCESKIAEVWCTKGWSELEYMKPRYYTVYKGFTYLVFDGLGSYTSEKLSNKLLSNLVGIQLEEDIGLPPNTGFPDRWIYRLDYPTIRVYSMVDSLFKYDDDISFNINLNTYSGNLFCY